MNASGQIHLIRKHPTLPVGIDTQGNAWCILTMRKLRRCCYDGRLVYRYGGKQLGYATFKKQPRVDLWLNERLPF